MELIRWAKSLDNGQVGGEKGGSTTFSMKTSKLFSPNARGEIPGAFRLPRQPDIKHMNLEPNLFLAGGEVTKLRGGGDDVMFSKELVARNSAKDNDGCEWKMVHFIPLSCHQGKVIEVAGELFAEGCARGETPAKNLIKIVEDEIESKDGTNACSFLSVKIVDSLVDANPELFKRTASDVKSIAERIITSFPTEINSFRDKSKYFSVDEAYYILNEHKLLSRQYTFKELLSTAREGQSADGEIEIVQALKQMAHRRTNILSLYTCPPIIFALIHIYDKDQGNFLVIDTHKIPAKVGGNGNGVLACVNYQAANLNDAIMDLARWIRERISSSIMEPSRQSLLELEATQVVSEETWTFPSEEEKASDDYLNLAQTDAESLKNTNCVWSSTGQKNLNVGENFDSSKILTNKEKAQKILVNFQPLLLAKINDSNTALTQRNNVDVVSKGLLPLDFKQWVPLTVSADGNCLYNAVSISLVGDLSVAALLRMLTASELFAHSEFYSKHPQLGDFSRVSRYSLSSIISIFLSENKALSVFNGNRNKVSRAIETMAQVTAKPYVFSSAFNILALASVIRRPIFAVHPDEPTALRMKLATHGFYYPREALTAGSDLDSINSDAIYVMWTRTNRLPINPWKPNHFVLLKKKTDAFPGKNYAVSAASERNTSSPSSSCPDTVESSLSKTKWHLPKVEDRSDRKVPNNSPNIIKSGRQKRLFDQSDANKEHGQPHKKAKIKSLLDAKPKDEIAGSRGSHTHSNPADINDEDVLPLKGPGFRWYAKRGITYNSNLARSEERTKNAVIIQDNEMKGLIRGNAKGSLAQNVEDLLERLSTAGSSKQHAHLSTTITLASHIMNNGLIVPTQDLAKKYKELKRLKESTHLESSCLLEIMSKHLNVAQIYIEGKGYIIENHGRELAKVVESLQQLRESDQSIVNRKVEEAVGSTYETLLKYLDTKRDRDTVKAILAKITSAKCMAKLANVQDKRSFSHSKGLVFRNLYLFEEMKQGIEVTEPTMSEEARRKKCNRLLQKMKIEKLRHIFKGRGRSLKCEEFPDLAGILEFAFGEGDRVDRAGGGLESHPRLTDTVLYRAADSNTIMRHARETILALAPEGFKISLSTCFNYTQNYREGTYQARRHHSGRGINACLSLHKPPRIGVEQFVINLHWSTQNVNLTLDMAHSFPNEILVDSKDAKAKISADVSPVQKPGKSWRKIILPDHDWNRSAQNAITPMSHLFIQTDLTLEDQKEQNLVYSVRRTGAAATLLNISYFEPETVHRVFNEIFLLLRNPSLDHLFRNPDTGKLKKHFAFIVDNGPSEAPSNPLVQMWLVRLARVLKLKSVTQKSFAEYHSKRNLVERVHAVQNHALSNEQFSSKGIYSEYEKGDEKHKANMEHMAEEVRKCLASTQYGGKACTVMRGIGGQENFVFNDEEHLVTFLGKNENRKADDILQYQPIKNDLWREVSIVWDLNENYTGSYREDYEIIQNKFHEDGQRTCWMDKYSTTIFNPDVECDSGIEAFTFQPLPDYIRWILTGGELHYLPLEKVQKLVTQVVADTPGAFLPSKILEMMFKVFSHGTDNILSGISFLTWCTEKDVTTFFQNYKEKLDKSFVSDKEKEYWSQDELYQCNSKEQLEELCRKERIPTEGKKYDCVKRLVEKMGYEKPPPLEEYNGDLSSLPDSITDIAKLSIYKLKEILRFHNVLDCGTKDELVVRVGMVRGGRKYLAFHRELEAIRNLITATRSIITAEKELYLEDPKVIHKRRKFFTKSGPSVNTVRPRDSASIPNQNQNAFLEVPNGLSLENLEEALTPLSNELLLYQKQQQQNIASCEKVTLETVLEAVRSVGTRVRILWERDEVGTSGWRTGK